MPKLYFMNIKTKLTGLQNLSWKSHILSNVTNVATVVVFEIPIFLSLHKYITNEREILSMLNIIFDFNSAM